MSARPADRSDFSSDLPPNVRPIRPEPLGMRQSDYESLPAIARIDVHGRHWVLLSALRGDLPVADAPQEVCEVYFRAADPGD